MIRQATAQQTLDARLINVHPFGAEQFGGDPGHRRGLSSGEKRVQFFLYIGVDTALDLCHRQILLQNGPGQSVGPRVEISFDGLKVACRVDRAGNSVTQRRGHVFLHQSGDVPAPVGQHGVQAVREIIGQRPCHVNRRLTQFGGMPGIVQAQLLQPDAQGLLNNPALRQPSGVFLRQVRGLVLFLLCGQHASAAAAVQEDTDHAGADQSQDAEQGPAVEQSRGRLRDRGDLCFLTIVARVQTFAFTGLDNAVGSAFVGIGVGDDRRGIDEVRRRELLQLRGGLDRFQRRQVELRLFDDQRSGEHRRCIRYRPGQSGLRGLGDHIPGDDQHVARMQA